VAIAYALLCTPIAGCLTPPDHTPTDTLDEATGDTYTSVAQPLVFARRRADVAANARDYATIAATHRNHLGSLRTYLLAYRSATLDIRPSALPGPAQGRLRFIADGRVIDLQPLADAAEAAILHSGLAAPRAGAMARWSYAVDVATLQTLADAAVLQLQFPDEALAEPFEVFTDGRAALRAFARQSAP
jgi:hypothetical protein